MVTKTNTELQVLYVFPFAVVFLLYASFSGVFCQGSKVSRQNCWTFSLLISYGLNWLAGKLWSCQWSLKHTHTLSCCCFFLFFFFFSFFCWHVSYIVPQETKEFPQIFNIFFRRFCFSAPAKRWHLSDLSLSLKASRHPQHAVSVLCCSLRDHLSLGFLGSVRSL